jgi:putative serine protease PepD
VATGVLDTAGPARLPLVREVARPALASTSASGLDDAVDLARDVAPAIVRLELDGSDAPTGSGVLFRSDGDVLTNAHLVVAVGGTLRAVLADGRVRTARLIGFDDDSDIAVLKLDGPGPYPTALLGTADGIVVGQPAIAVGAPRSGTPAGALMNGVVSAMGREVASARGSMLLDMIQTDAPIPVWASGGALIDRSGAVVGITTTPADELGRQGLGFAVPVDLARAVADDLVLMGRVRTVWLGVRGETLGSGAGVTIAELLPGSPAGAAGLQVGDVVRRVDGRPVGSMVAMRVALRRRHPGDRVVVVYDRAGHRRTAELVLTERPPA